MRKAAKGWLAAAAVLAAAGLILFAAVMTVCRWDYSRLSTESYETNTHEIREGFSSIRLNTETADLLFVPSEDDTCRVVCYEPENRKHSVSVQGDTLLIEAAAGKGWPEKISFDFHSPAVTVALPQTAYASLLISGSTGNVEVPDGFRFEEAQIILSTGDVLYSASGSGSVKIGTSTGGIRVEGVSAGSLDLSVSTGSVTVSGVSCTGDLKANAVTGAVRVSDTVCRNFFSEGNTGGATLKNVIAGEMISVERSTGDVLFDGSDAAEISVETSTGDVTGSLLSEKVFLTDTSVGEVSVPPTVTGGKCTVRTSTGEIRLTVGE